MLLASISPGCHAKCLGNCLDHHFWTPVSALGSSIIYMVSRTQLAFSLSPFLEVYLLRVPSSTVSHALITYKLQRDLYHDYCLLVKLLSSFFEARLALIPTVV